MGNLLFAGLAVCYAKASCRGFRVALLSVPVAVAILKYLINECLYLSILFSLFVIVKYYYCNMIALL